MLISVKYPGTFLRWSCYGPAIRWHDPAILLLLSFSFSAISLLLYCYSLSHLLLLSWHSPASVLLLSCDRPASLLVLSWYSPGAHLRAKIRIIRKFPPSAQTTGNGTACTAEGCTMTFPPRRPKRPETKAHARQEHASGQNSRPDSRNNQKRKHMHCRSTHQDKVPAPTAQTTRNESTCTAEAHITTKLPPPPAQTTRNESARTAEAHISTKFPPRRPKRPETKAHARQERASGKNCLH